MALYDLRDLFIECLSGIVRGSWIYTKVNEIEASMSYVHWTAHPVPLYESLVAPTLLSSKSFSPSAFLSHHHPDATFQDLRYGVEHLRRNVESKGEEVRILVEREFGRFVGVKGSNDGQYGPEDLSRLT